MFRIDSPGATEDNKFTEGDPAAGTRATVVSAEWLNAIQEELANAVEGEGAALDKENSAQLRQLFASRVIRVGDVTQLAAINSPQPGWQASLAGDNPGIFEFDDSNLSSEVLSDPIRYVAPGGEDGSSGAWVYQEAIGITTSSQSSVLDKSGASYIGNMTAGGGLSAILDNPSTSGSGYIEDLDGWAGVSLPSPESVGRAVFYTDNSGFDSTVSSNKQVILELYGKAGSAPSSQTDGTLLGRRVFVDLDLRNSVTVKSDDISGEFDHIWGRVLVETTWAKLTGLEFYAPETAAVLSMFKPTVMQQTCNETELLPQDSIFIQPFTVDFFSEAPGVVSLDFSINLVHRGDGLSPSYTGAVGVGGRIYYKYANAHADLDTAAWVELPASGSNGINIDERNPAHYANISAMSGLPINKGYYRFGIKMSGHSDGTTQDYIAGVLAEYGDGKNAFRITYLPNSFHLDMSAPKNLD